MIISTYTKVKYPKNEKRHYTLRPSFTMRLTRIPVVRQALFRLPLSWNGLTAERSPTSRNPTSWPHVIHECSILRTTSEVDYSFVFWLDNHRNFASITTADAYDENNLESSRETFMLHTIHRVQVGYIPKLLSLRKLKQRYINFWDSWNL